MLHQNLERPHTIEEVIEFLKTLPQDMGCVHTRVEFDYDVIYATKISDKPKRNMIVSLVELRFEKVPK